jgi:NADH dehydrogenase [ubiquinone] 1 alpha subcomplex assembly factor 5
MKSVRKYLCLCTARHFSTESNLIFDTALKALHRDRAAHLLSSTTTTQKDPLLTTVADRLVDRLEDCTRPFPHVLVLGGAGLEVLTRLRGGRAGVEKATYVDTSPSMLQRAERVIKQSNNNNENEGKKWPEVEYVQASSTEKELLPVKPDTFDAVISCLGLHWVNDIPVRCNLSIFEIKYHHHHHLPISAYQLSLYQFNNVTD